MKKSERIGQTFNSERNGKMTIVAYRKSSDIDVRFEDGTIVKNKTYKAFCAGSIRNPNGGVKQNKRISYPSPTSKESSRLGEATTSNQGMGMTIIRYKDAHDIDVRFEDGTIVQHKTYVAFSHGGICNPNLPMFLGNRAVVNHIGETGLSAEGEKITIADYKSKDNIVVRFDDGVEARARKYCDFKNGTISRPRDYKKERIGETGVTTHGEKMTICGYKSATDIDVMFEDGSVATHKAYTSFKIGRIARPGANKEYRLPLAGSRLGEVNINNHGAKMMIVGYNGATDVNIAFENGAAVEHKNYQSFKNGKIACPKK